MNPVIHDEAGGPAPGRGRAHPTPMSAGSPCRNCGAVAPGNYCPECGQETNLALPSAASFLREAAGRYVALDGRMWRTLANLLARPGFLTREYFAGRRRRYVRPAKLFITLSIAMFAVFRLVGHAPVLVATGPAVSGDVAAIEQGHREMGNAGVRVTPDFDLDLDVGDWPRLAPLRKRIEAFNRLSHDEKAAQIFYGTLRYAPYAAIGLLPVYALLLQIAYAGSGRRYPLRPRRYAAHLVYAAHNHAFLFVLGILFAVVPRPLRTPLALWALVYGIVSMKVVYGGRWSGAVVRAAVTGVVYAFFFVLAVAALLVAAITLR